MAISVSVTYNIVTPESCEHGDFDEIGFIEEPGPLTTLRDCINSVYTTRTSHVDGITCRYSDRDSFTPAFTICNGMEFLTGAQETRTLHITGCTTASVTRLFKLLHNVYGGSPS